MNRNEENKLYAKAKEEIANSRELICSGCGKRQGGDIVLSFSHLISRADCRKIEKDYLIVEKKNIALHCMTFGQNLGCHTKWENKDQRGTLLDYQKNISYITKEAPELLQRYLSN